MNLRPTALVALAGAMTLVTAAGGAATPSRQRVAITARGGVAEFVLNPLKPGVIKSDSGGASWCCWSQRFLVRDGQRVEVNDPLVTLTGRRGILTIRFRIEWLDAGNGYTVGVSTWKVVSGTSAYKGVTGGGRGASSWLPRGPVSFRAEGYLRAK